MLPSEMAAKKKKSIKIKISIDNIFYKKTKVMKLTLKIVINL